MIGKRYDIKRLQIYETYLDNLNIVADIRKARDGYLVHIIDLRNYLKHLKKLSYKQIQEQINYSLKKLDESSREG